jgi:hypothetical protein
LTINATCCIPLDRAGAICITAQINPTEINAPIPICSKGNDLASRLAPHSGQVCKVPCAERPHTWQRTRPITMGFSWPQ